MAALKPEVKAFIVQSLRALIRHPKWSSPSKKNSVSGDPPAGCIARPDKGGGKGLAQKWVDLFNRTRDRFLNEISDIPIANKAYRLRVLQRMSTTAEGMKNLGMTAQLLEQAAKEVGDAYSNKQKVELTGKDGGPLNQVTYTAEDYAKAQQKLEGRLEGLD
jgi:hypothetical protein